MQKLKICEVPCLKHMMHGMGNQRRRLYFMEYDTLSISHVYVVLCSGHLPGVCLTLSLSCAGTIIAQYPA